MPVSLECLTPPLTDQDAVDVGKILKETRALWQEDLAVTALDAPMLDAPMLDARALLHQLHKRCRLMGGRFNDHLIGLLLLEQRPLTYPKAQGVIGDQDDEQLFEILGVSVRPLTQRRSVARQMLIGLCQQARVNGWCLSVSKHRLERAPYLQPSLAVQGFYTTQEAWVWSPRDQ